MGTRINSRERDNLGRISHDSWNIRREPKLFARWQLRCGLSLSILHQLVWFAVGVVYGDCEISLLVAVAVAAAAAAVVVKRGF